jgi:hypothetical protein
MTDLSRHIESEEKFHHLFAGIIGAILAAAIQTVKFENLGKYGIISELLGWIVLMVSFFIAIFNAFKIQDSFYTALEIEQFGGLLDKASEPQTCIFLGEQLRKFSDQLSRLKQGSKRRIYSQFFLFLIGIVLIGFSRSIVGCIKLKALF